jgi:hypothetical protein
MLQGISVPSEITVTDAVIESVAAQVESADESTVRQVIAALNNVTTGDRVNTIRRNEQTGAVATRIVRDGLYMWSVVNADGSTYNDMQPTLDWTLVYEPPAPLEVSE